MVPNRLFIDKHVANSPVAEAIRSRLNLSVEVVDNLRNVYHLVDCRYRFPDLPEAEIAFHVDNIPDVFDKFLGIFCCVVRQQLMPGD